MPAASCCTNANASATSSPGLSPMPVSPLPSSRKSSVNWNALLRPAINLYSTEPTGTPMLTSPEYSPRSLPFFTPIWSSASENCSV
jgi:hypothetical protein